MPQGIGEGFAVSSASPIDNRIVATNQSAFNSITAIGGRSYLGMLVFFTSDNSLHFVSQLNGASAPTLTEFNFGSTSLSALGLDSDLTTFSVPANTTITSHKLSGWWH